MSEDTSLVKAPRICTMSKEPSGYGFNLHGEKGVIGQYISAVDPDGPADHSGLCIGDRVVEVNETNIETFSHAEVVAIIKSKANVTSLLVVDKVTDNYLKNIGKPVTAELAQYESVYDLDNQKSRDENTNNEIENQSAEEKPKDEEETVSVSLNNVHLTPENQETEENRNDPQATNHTYNNDYSHENIYDMADTKPKPDIQIENSTIPEAVNHDQSDNVSDDINVRNPSISSEGKPSKDKVVPKRKQVKESKTDWKSKANMFNNL